MRLILFRDKYSENRLVPTSAWLMDAYLLLYFKINFCINISYACTLSGPPSAPRNAISNVNETSVFLEWSIPTETGGRKDVRYNILCRRVLPDGRGLEECGPNVRFLPRRVGLSNTSVMVADLQSHTNYSFLLEAVNGVSELARDHAKQYVSLNVTTNQAGEWPQIRLGFIHQSQISLCVQALNFVPLLCFMEAAAVRNPGLNIWV